MSGWNIKQVLVPVDDLDASLKFYTSMGLGLKFRDGDRYAALDGGTITIALVSNREDVTGGRVALAISVDDIDSNVRRAVEHGASLVTPVDQGPHESRAVLGDPSGQTFVLYSKTQ